jgi:NDP-sugar pyrophosphorylase family protein
MPNSVPSNFQNCAAEFVAVLLASSVGSKLFPITSTEFPKHMLPVAGISVISRLLMAIEASGFQDCVVVIARDDELTMSSLKKRLVRETKNSKGCYQILSRKPHLVLGSEDKLKKITLLQLDEDCHGSIDALRKVEETAVIAPSSNMVVIPGDLVVFDVTVFSKLCDKHRRGYQGPTKGSKSSKLSTACTILLNDVGEQDEHGVPLKESAKVRLVVMQL